MIDAGPDDAAVSAAGIARSYLASFATGDPDAVSAHVAAGFVNDHASALGAGCVGRDEYRNRLPGFLGSFVGLRYDVRSLIADEESGSVAVEYRMTARSDDRPIDIRGVMVMTVEAGLITRRTDYWDALTFLRQIDQAP